MFYQCKMCGGTLEIKNNDTVGVCEYCGTKQTLPRLDNDKKANLYERAAHFRQLNDYDKAMSLYEQVLAEDKTDAEAYWSIVLCRYGIEYVEDPRTHKRIPTVNRVHYEPVEEDRDYLSAVKYADLESRELYQAEARQIDRIQKSILSISKNEEPYDVFICYKETDDNNERTPDSVMSYELYRDLTKEGFKVFFSRITLEDKLGTAYEPYIFAALNSAKVMLAIGTRPEYFNAVWVKNEWSRFLAMIKEGKKKYLIPLYKDMSPQDLPKEMTRLQAQDMSKIGAMQDVVHGVIKLIRKDTKAKVTIEDSVSTDALMKRGLFELDDREWDNAKSFFNQVLNHDPENGDAYIGLLLAEMGVSDFKDLAKSNKKFDFTNEYKKAVRFADPEVAEQLKKYAKVVNDAFAERSKREKYDSAKIRYDSAVTESEFRNIAIAFKELGDYQDSLYLAGQCERRAEGIIRNKEINRKKKRKKLAICITTIGTVLALAAICIGTFYYKKVIVPEKKYQEANRLLEVQDYEGAITKFKELIEYKDSKEKVAECERQMERQGMMELFRNAAVGDIVEFGHDERERTNNPNEWIVLDKDDNQVLLLSKSGVDFKIYGNTGIWEKSLIRTYLNDSYLDKYFTDEERSIIKPTEINNNSYSDTGVVQYSNPTQDKIWLLSTEEAERYLESDSERQCDNHDWWLRSSGRSGSQNSAVRQDGSISNGFRVEKVCLVRPALYIDISL